MKENKQIVEAFCKDCVWAWIVYDHYVKLFERGEERIKLLDRVASHFFQDIHNILKNYLFSQICKITDPADTLGKSNLTTNYLVEKVPWPPETKEELKRISTKLNSFRNHIIPARHKILSHSDLKTYIEKDSLGAFPEGEDKVFWDNLQNFVDVAYRHYFGEPYPIEAISEYDAEALVDALKKSVDYDEYFSNRPQELFQRICQMKFADA